MLSDSALTAFRAAATLVHAFGDMRARVRDGSRIVVDVRPHDHSCVPDGALLMAPAQFRCAVSQAHRLAQEGEGLCLVGLPDCAEPSIDIGTPPGGAALSGGIYRLPRGDENLFTFAVTLDAEVAYSVGEGLVDEAGPMPEVVSLGLRRDRATAVSVAFARTTAPIGSPQEADLVELLESLMARWVVHELITPPADIQLDR